MKKIFVSLVLVLCITTQAFAWWPVAFSLAGHAIAFAAAVYYGSRTGVGAKVGADGKVMNPASVQWVDTKSLDASGHSIDRKQKDVNADISAQQMKNIVNAHPEKYPKL